MHHKLKGRNAPRQGTYPQRVLTPNRKGFELPLKRLPQNFCWRLLRRLLDVSSDELSSGVRSHLSQVFRKEDPSEYYALDAQYGLQCIANWVNPMRGNPAVIHMLVSAFRKCSNLELVPSRERAIQCLANAKRIDDAIPALRSEWLTDEVYVRAKAWILSTLGAAPSPEAVQFSSRHGPGSTASIPYCARSLYYKFFAPYRTTPSARSHLVNCITTDPRWWGVLEDDLRRRLAVPFWSILDQEKAFAEYVDGGYPYNVLTTVPKDGRKDRPIAKEQTGNIYLQLGVGSILRSRLRGVGVDLNRQAEINRAVALESSRTKEYFTVDLSSASDTVGYDFVKAMLPPDWFRLLDSLRAPWGVLPSGEAFRYRKFSSMGNGFTFELESLLFLALCEGIRRSYGVRSDRVFAFGDDILGPDYLYLHCRRYLSYSGFIVNSEKSFNGTARVRESCGVDAMDGLNIRPFYVKRVPQDAMEAIGLRNRVRSWFIRQLGSYPIALDDLLIGDCFEQMPPIGPDSDVEFDGWLQDGPWAVGRTFRAITGTVTRLPAREFGFRKLMHSLRDCSGEGGNFLVSESSERVRLVGRVVDRQFDWLCDN